MNKNDNTPTDPVAPDPVAPPVAVNPAPEEKAAKKEREAGSRKGKDTTTPPEDLKHARKTDNSDMYSGRMPAEWFDLVKILKAKHPGKKIGAVLTDSLKRGLAKDDEAELTATISKHPTLDGEEYMRIRASYAPIPKALKSFRADLLEIDQNTEDPERSEKLIELFKNNEEVLESTLTLNTRLARIALLPNVPSGDELIHLFYLRNDFTKLRNEASTPEERAKYSLALKLIGPYLP